ncbi:hypothetical protein QE152_g33471 [Popillia japonica]|uniref:HAT C-terminal dimerisation domain-containing protein n=1 Tax=Popillia japonica TaxID=7064 RepID=A0AAW1IWM1_POPJA
MFGKKRLKEWNQYHYQTTQLQGESTIWPVTRNNNLFEQFKVALTLLSNSTKPRMSVRAVQGSPYFAIQLDETTDVAGLAQLIVFVRDIFQDEVFEDLLFCKQLKTSTKGDIFQDEVFEDLLFCKQLKTSTKEKQYDWIRDPFGADVTDTNLSACEKEQLIEVSCDPTLETKHLNSGALLLEFWIGVRQEYKELSGNALKFLLGFSTTYLCERGFTSLTYLKNKYRNKLNVEDDLRLYLTKLEPNIDQLCKEKQAHPSD